MDEKKATRVAYGEYLKELGGKNEKIVVLDADLSVTTNTSKFKEAYPDRFFNCGIAECNMVDMAAGLSTMGYVPFASTFAIFGAGRAYEQIRNGIAYPKFNVKLAFTHAGISVGEDGGSHQSVEDIALMRVVPGMTVLVPADATETRQVMDAAMEIKGPVFIRLSRQASRVLPETEFKLGKAKVLREGTDVALICCGLMVERCLDAAELLAEKGVSAAVINMPSIKPFDEETVREYAKTRASSVRESASVRQSCAVREYAKKCAKVITAEEHSVIGGLGDAVASALCGMGGFKFMKIGLNDVFGESAPAEELFREYGLTAEQIAEKVLSL